MAKPPARPTAGAKKSVETNPVEVLQYLKTLPRLPALADGDRVEGLIPGVDVWKNRVNPFAVVRVHYTADPDRRPGTPWFATKTKDAGGVTSAKWRKEQEIDFRAQAGTRVFDQFNPDVHRVPVRELPRWCHRWVVWDYGLRNPTAMLVFATNDKGEHEQELELYVRGASVRESAYLAHKKIFERYRDWIPERDRIEFDDDTLTVVNRQVLESWYFTFFEGIIGDPSMGERREKDTGTVLEKFADAGWYIAPARSRAVTGLSTVNDWFKEQRAFVQASCVNTLREINYLVWADHQDPTRNYQEREADKDNHTTDCWKMFANQFPSDAERPVPQEKLDMHNEDLQIRALLEQMRADDEGQDMLTPTLGGFR